MVKRILEPLASIVARTPLFWPQAISLSSIRGRLALVMAIVFLPTGLLALQAGLAGVDARRQAIQQSAGANELRAIAPFREELAKSRDVVRVLAAQAPDLLRAPNRCTAALAKLRTELLEYQVLSIVGADGKIVCASNSAYVGLHANAVALIEKSAKSGMPVTGFVPQPRIGAEPMLAAVQQTSAVSNGKPLYSGITRPAAQMLRQIMSASDNRSGFAAIVSAEEGRVFSVGESLAGISGVDLLKLVRQEPAFVDGRAMQIGPFWAIASRVSPDGLIVVRGWRPAPLSFFEGVSVGWAVAAPLLLWALAVVVTWFMIELFVTRPLTLVEALARAYARGEDTKAEESLLRAAPVEITSLRRTLAALAKMLKTREARIVEALDEERALLREVNHRVKNNLQMMASMLAIQARSAEEPAEARGLTRAHDRVQLLAIAYRHIYESGEVRGVALDELAGDVARALVGRRTDAQNVVHLVLELEHARGSVDRAVPFAFVVGEALVSLMARLPPGRECDALVALKKRDDQSLNLLIASDQAAPLGEESTQEARILSAFGKQLDASLQFSTENRFEVSMTLTPEINLAKTEMDEA